MAIRPEDLSNLYPKAKPYNQLRRERAEITAQKLAQRTKHVPLKSASLTVAFLSGAALSVDVIKGAISLVGIIPSVFFAFFCLLAAAYLIYSIIRTINDWFEQHLINGWIFWGISVFAMSTWCLVIQLTTKDLLGYIPLLIILSGITVFAVAKFMMRYRQ